MLYNDRIGLSEGIDVIKSTSNKECIVCHCCFFEFKFQNSVCNCCHDFSKFCLNLSDTAITTGKGVDYRYIILNTNKSDPFPVLLILCLMIVYPYKMHAKKINNKNSVCN